MSERRNTKRKSLFSALKTNAKRKKQSNNQHTSSEPSRFQVVSGTRRKNRQKRLVFYAVTAVLLLTLFIVHLILPTGLLEGIQNAYSKMGSGELPLSFYSANPVDYQKFGDVSCVLNNTFFEVYNEKGKLMQAVSHGLSNPQLEVSEARFLLFDRDRYTVKTYKYSTELSSMEFKNPIISADISRSGAYAVVTGADSYLGSVYVYNKNNDLIFSWNSANSYISDVAVADNGKSIAVSLFNAKDGAYSSTINVFNLKSATPVQVYKVDGLITALKSVNKNYFLAHGIDKAVAVPWKDDNMLDLHLNGVVRYTDIADNGISAIAYGREYNESDNNIVIFDKRGAKQAEFTFRAKISDISVLKESIMILSNEKLYCVDFSGNIKSETVCDIKPLFIGAINEEKCLTVDNSKMNLIKLSK